MLPPAPWRDLARPPVPDPGCALIGYPWSIRLAGSRSGRPALEFYEAGELIDVVSSTPLAAALLRGARSVSTADGRRAVAWGRLQAARPDPEAEFTSGLFVHKAQSAVVIKVTPWCWLAIADGRFDAVTVRCGVQRVRRRLDRC
jgi:hypothetical protein